MATYELSQAESDTIMTQGVDFGITQLVNGNWGVLGIIPKVIFEEAGVDRRRIGCSQPPPNRPLQGQPRRGAEAGAGAR